RGPFTRRKVSGSLSSSSTKGRRSKPYASSTNASASGIGSFVHSGGRFGGTTRPITSTGSGGCLPSVTVTWNRYVPMSAVEGTPLETRGSVDDPVRERYRLVRPRGRPVRRHGEPEHVNGQRRVLAVGARHLRPVRPDVGGLRDAAVRAGGADREPTRRVYPG